MPSDDILLPPVTYTPKPRWFEVTVKNPAAKKGQTRELPTLQALGEVQPVDADAQPVGMPPARDSSLDLAVTFDPEDPDHRLMEEVMNRIVKKAYQLRLDAEAQGVPPTDR